MDIGVPWAVMRKGMTPWISEQVAKQANPSGFSPSRRRFLKGSAAAAAGTATGIPLLKQVAKTVPDFFANLATGVASSLKNVTTEKALLSGYGSKFEPVLNVLARLRRKYVDKRYPMEDSYRKEPRPYGVDWSDITPGGVDADKVVSELEKNMAHFSAKNFTPGSSLDFNPQLDNYLDEIYYNLNDLQPVSDLYKSNPKEFISSLNKEIKWLEGRVKAEKPSGLQGVDWEKIKKSDTPTQYFDSVADQTMTYNPSLAKKWEAELKAAKDMLKELR
jgi:hypothetical protein